MFSVFFFFGLYRTIKSWYWLSGLHFNEMWIKVFTISSHNIIHPQKRKVSGSLQEKRWHVYKGNVVLLFELHSYFRNAKLANGQSHPIVESQGKANGNCILKHIFLVQVSDVHGKQWFSTGRCYAKLNLPFWILMEHCLNFYDSDLLF